MGRAEEGWHFLAGHGQRHSLPDAGQRADRQAPDAISGGAPLGAGSFRFSTDSRKQGKGEGAYVTEPPAPGAGGGGWGTGQGRLTDSSRTWSCANSGGGERPSPPWHRCLGALSAAGLTKPCVLPAPAPFRQPSGCRQGRLMLCKIIQHPVGASKEPKHEEFKTKCRIPPHALWLPGHPLHPHPHPGIRPSSRQRTARNQEGVCSFHSLPKPSSYKSSFVS